MADANLVTPYDSVAVLTPIQQTWINEYDRRRYAAYDVYDAIYNNVEGAYSVALRGGENKPVYLPVARTLIKTLNRYTAVAPTLGIDAASDSAKAGAAMAFDNLFKRERFWSKFQSNKMLGMRRGDWLWHIVANPLKMEGQRISIYAVDPRNYFKIFDPNDIDRTIGCHIIEQVVENDETYIKRQTYTKGLDPLAPEDSLIYSSTTLWKMDEWEDPTKAPVKTLIPPTPLPPQITALPVYHIPHNEEVGNPYGISDLQGLESVLRAIVQSISDESLALELEGIGLYATTSGPPRSEETGQPVPWQLGPGRVVEHPEGTDFKRITGIGSVTPYQDHLNFILENGLKQPAGVTDAAIGKVDAVVAESGIALALQLAPTLAETDRNDRTIADIHNQMFYDLIQWLNVYEGAGIDPGVTVEILFGQKIPTNRKEIVDELNNMFDKGIIDSVYYREKMEQFGYEFVEGMAMNVAKERNEMMAAVADPTLSRAESELDSA